MSNHTAARRCKTPSPKKGPKAVDKISSGPTVAASSERGEMPTTGGNRQTLSSQQQQQQRALADPPRKDATSPESDSTPQEQRLFYSYEQHLLFLELANRNVLREWKRLQPPKVCP